MLGPIRARFGRHMLAGPSELHVSGRGARLRFSAHIRCPKVCGFALHAHVAKQLFPVIHHMWPQWAPVRKMGKNLSAFFSNFVGCFYGNILGLKTPGNYSDQFWFSKISILLCEGPKPPIAVIYRFFGPIISVIFHVLHQISIFW